MKRKIALLVLSALGMTAPTEGASTTRSTDDQVKKLVERCTQIEGQLDRSVHYLKKAESNGATKTEQAWFDGAGDLIKVTVEKTNSSERELTEYSGDFFHHRMFMLTRKELPLPDGGAQVDESRDYFSDDGDLIRKLTKNARFKAEESTDTGRTLAVIDAETGKAGWMNHGGIEPSRWSADGSLLLWKVAGKWSPRALVLVKIDNGEVKWQRNLLKMAQKEILARTRKASPTKYAAIKKRNSVLDQDTYPDGFTVNVQITGQEGAPLTFPLNVEGSLESDPKAEESPPKNSVPR